MITEYLQSLFFIFIAEMGDKTQILAMMFATKYKIRKVFLGIFLGSLLNHGLAVAFGSLMGSFIQPYILQVVAGAAFIGFSIWTLGGEEEEEDLEESSRGRGAVITVAAAFFIGELGDKTQLTAITLSVDALYPVFVLAGTVSGMVLTSGIGILAGSKLGNRMPGYLIKLFSGTLFFVFGTTKLASSTPDNWRNGATYGLFALVTLAALFFIGRILYRQRHKLAPTALEKAAERLFNFTNEMKKSTDEICRGINHCGVCKGDQCAVGFIRHMLSDIENSERAHSHEKMIADITFYHDKFSKTKLDHALEMANAYLNVLEPGSDGYKQADTIREVLERMLVQKEEKDHV